MHYRNGTLAQNGDLVVYINGVYSKLGIIHHINPQTDHCNAYLSQGSFCDLVNLKDCVSLDDVIEFSNKNNQAHRNPKG